MSPDRLLIFHIMNKNHTIVLSEFSKENFVKENMGIILLKEPL